jgi:hypothetical protein
MEARIGDYPVSTAAPARMTVTVGRRIALALLIATVPVFPTRRSLHCPESADEAEAARRRGWVRKRMRERSAAAVHRRAEIASRSSVFVEVASVLGLMRKPRSRRFIDSGSADLVVEQRQDAGANGGDHKSTRTIPSVHIMSALAGLVAIASLFAHGNLIGC